ncbi:hypothetical protein NG821_01115 [Prevotella cerevisiae]|uniref:Uncharacterized protein n=1 Tax=Segatella cerevisiae TaxID=2053716 RepID=A0ABT1BTR1_9BACT|nr:hypothetical protein [Segatella cerevisiae]MCO6024457.1 hypothetical protein [Segatella cerevisiae]
METTDNIELRSERVRKIIGKVPPRLISVGITIVTLFIAGMILVVTTVHFPFTIECSGGIHYFEVFPSTYYYANIEVPYRYLYLFHEHRRFNISFEGFSENETVVATTDAFDDRVITKEGENYFVAFARVLNPRVYGHVIQPNQKFKAVTVVSDKTLLNLIFHGDTSAR